MVPNWGEVLGFGGAAALYWSALGWPLARRCLPRALRALAFAPLLGWAVQTALAASLLPLTGFGMPALLAVALAPLALVWTLHWRRPPDAATQPLSLWTLPVAALLACLPTAAILPKHTQGGISLASPIFDHSKIAIIDAIARLGLPPVNPYYGGAEAGPHLAYYYWWHLSAAELARLAGATGWAADAAMTWFTAAASLLLLAGMAQALDRRAGLWAVLLAIPASIRPLLAPAVHAGWLLPATGLGGWLDQASWAPQHLAAAATLMLAVLVLAGVAERRTPTGIVVLGCVIATGFGASAWVGGIVGVLAIPAAALALLTGLARNRRAFLCAALAAGILSLILAAPLLHTEYLAAAGRHAFPLTAAFYPVLGPAIGAPAGFGFPLLLLIEFPVATILGIWGIIHAGKTIPPWARATLAAGLVGALICLCLRSTIDNNDLGWRAILPALLAATPFAAATAVRLWQAGGARIALVILIPLLGLTGAWHMLRDNLLGQATPAGRHFLAEAAEWRAIRGITGPAARIASDPRLDASMTPWADNIGWALLATRAACYAGWATAQPFAPVPAAALYAIDQRINRIFDGAPAPGDLAALTTHLRCDYALLTARSPGFTQDPFATDPAAQLIAGVPGQWRLYRLRPPITP
jgi:hypothetical protein